MSVNSWPGNSQITFMVVAFTNIFVTIKSTCNYYQNKRDRGPGATGWQQCECGRWACGDDGVGMQQGRGGGSRGGVWRRCPGGIGRRGGCGAGSARLCR